jgi:hypothetical protein
LLNTGDKPAFLFVFNGVEYRDGTVTGSPAAQQGITASIATAAGGTFASQPLSVNAKGDTYITVP